MSDYNYFMDNLSKLGKVNRSTIEKMADVIALQESNYDPAAVQALKGGGTGAGRGLFQYELDKSRYGGKTSGAAVTAGIRLKNFYKNNDLEAPEWVQNLPKSFDPSELTEEQQRMLFAADAYYKNKGDLKEWDSKGFSPLKWWADKHKGVGMDKISKNEEERFKKYLSSLESPKAEQFAQSDDPFVRMAQQSGTMTDAGMEGTGPIPVSQQQVDQEAANWARLRAQLEQETGIYANPSAASPETSQVAPKDDELFFNKLLKRFWD